MKLAQLFLALTVAVISAHSETLPERLQNLSVTIHSSGGQGSGVLITRNDENYVLTCAHVVEDNRRVLKIQEGQGEEVKTRAEFSPVKVVREILKNGRSVGSTEVEADVVAYSSAEYGDDLALLKIRDVITKESVKFFRQDIVSPPIGTKLSHVGSFLGQRGSNSFSEGRISQIGRVLFDKVFDQTDVIAFPGSSGGGIFISDTGEYAGTLVRGAAPGYILYVPMRRIVTWAKKHNVEFIFDENGKPGEIKLEDREPVARSSDGKYIEETKQYPFLFATKPEEAK